jgi:hypothetical protein
MNGCMGITKDLLMYFMECTYDEWLYEYCKGSTVVLYWVLIIMNGCMSITRDLVLYYIDR